MDSGTFYNNKEIEDSISSESRCDVIWVQELETFESEHLRFGKVIDSIELVYSNKDFVELAHKAGKFVKADIPNYIALMAKAPEETKKIIEAMPANPSVIEQLKSEKNSYPDSEQNIALFHSARFNRVQLSLLSLLLSKTPLVNVERLSHSDVISFAQTALEFNRQNLVNAMSATSNIDSAQYINHHKLLIRSLLTGSWFGSLYEKSERLAFRNPWLDIKIGISELQTILLLQQQLRKLAEADAKLTKWLDSKIEHLLLTLEQSRVQAVASLPYWDC